MILLVLSLTLVACNEGEKSKSEPYYAEATPPRRQEFRWSNGKVPKTLDPARAMAPPETDLVRAVFEGLTELDPASLEAIPGVAESWTPSDDFKTWTFHLRTNARWSNGKPLSAEDFVRSWKRLSQMGDSAAHQHLLSNLVGSPVKQKETAEPGVEPKANSSEQDPQASPSAPVRSTSGTGSASAAPMTERSTPSTSLGVTAVDQSTLRVELVAPDKDFARLVAHPIFRPVFGEGSELAANHINTGIVGNGPFRITSVDASGITLEPSDTYWNRQAVKLERVRFVATENAEEALVAYKAGELDAITNADFEPLALKLLEPFGDFRRRTHAAVNFYEINHEKAPFDDRRVREALTISIERERLTEGEMEGRTQPALSFLPFNGSPGAKIVQDKERALELLDEAGFPAGANFPVIRLVINRNDTQQRVARAVARMWKQNLNIETEIIVKENAQVEEARNAGDFDLVRRGVVFPTADELISILAILRPAKTETSVSDPSSGARTEGVEAEDPGEAARERVTVESPDVTMSEANAVYELWAIPLYFPTSYSLVKPYVSGFEMNSLDTPLLQRIVIDTAWQTK